MQPCSVRPAAATERGAGRRLELREDVEDLERDHAAAVGRVAGHPDAAVHRGDGCFPGAAVVPEVSACVQRPGGGKAPGHALAKVAVVVGVEPLVGQGLQRACERREADELAGLPRPALRAPDLAKAPGPRLRPELPIRRLHGPDEPVPRREPGTREVDGGGEHGVPPETSPPRVCVAPRAHGPRHGDREGPTKRNAVEAGGAERRDAALQRAPCQSR